MDRNTPKILFVDDDANVLKAMKRENSSRGSYRV